MKKGTQGLGRKIKTEVETVKVKFNEEDKKAEAGKAASEEKNIFSKQRRRSEPGAKMKDGGLKEQS